MADCQTVERLLSELPDPTAVPRREGDLAFDAPWEVRALAMAVELHGAGRFPWTDFQSELIGAIQQWENTPPEIRGEWSYYQCWVRALQRLTERQGLIDPDELEQRTEEFLVGQRDPKHH